MRTLSVLFGSEDREDRTSVNSLRELSSQNVLAVRGIKRGIRGLFFYCNLKGLNHTIIACLRMTRINRSTELLDRR
jgi:hypothetical protein